MDLDMLARHFLYEFRTRYGADVEFSPRGLEALHAYDWPGNVRELRSVVQQAAVLSTDGRLGVADLMLCLRDRQPSSSAMRAEPKPRDAPPASAGGGPLREVERRTILDTWEASGQNLSATARTLGLPRSTLRDRLRKYGMR
jgi:DNA-binding NtrC family response regulator